MRREIAIRAAVGFLYAVAMAAVLRVSREVDTSRGSLPVAFGVLGSAALIHRSILRVYGRRYASRVARQ